VAAVGELNAAQDAEGQGPHWRGCWAVELLLQGG
jgi:hypothetical protein